MLLEVHCHVHTRAEFVGNANGVYCCQLSLWAGTDFVRLFAALLTGFIAKQDILVSSRALVELM